MNEVTIDANRVNEKVVDIVTSREAKRIVNSMSSPELPPVMRGDEFLAMEFPGEPWLFEGLIEVEQRVMLSGYRKAGKTTLMGHAVKAYCDGGAFLGQFDADESEDTDCPILYLNLEVPEKKFQDYLAAINIRNSGRLIIWNLRGIGFDLMNDDHYEQLDTFIRKEGVCSLFVDPLRKAYVGEENDNSFVKEVTERFDALMTYGGNEEGLTNLFVVAHTGHEQGNQQFEDPNLFARPRGASVWGDWPDVLLSLTTDRDHNRYLAMIGRNGELDPSVLRLEGGNLTLELGVGHQNVRAERIDDAVMAFVGANPVCSVSHVKDAVTGRNETITAAIERLVEAGRLVKDRDPGDRRRWLLRVSS